MVFFNYALRKLNAKIVYYGPGLCGKTTNLEWIHDHFEGGKKGNMLSLATEGDRTIFFDLLPLDIGTIRGMDVTLQLYTVPGQVHYNSTRQLVLRGADGVVFVADSQRAMLGSNLDSWKNLKENLLLQGVELASFPHVLQFNKRDLNDIAPVEQLDSELNEYSAPIFEAVAIQGIGVQETLEGIVKLVMRSLRERYEAEFARSSAAPSVPSGVSTFGVPATPPTLHPAASTTPVSPPAVTPATPEPPPVSPEPSEPRPAAGLEPPAPSSSVSPPADAGQPVDYSQEPEAETHPGIAAMSLASEEGPEEKEPTLVIQPEDVGLPAPDVGDIELENGSLETADLETGENVGAELVVEPDETGGPDAELSVPPPEEPVSGVDEEGVSGESVGSVRSVPVMEEPEGDEEPSEEVPEEPAGVPGEPEEPSVIEEEETWGSGGSWQVPEPSAPGGESPLEEPLAAGPAGEWSTGEEPEQEPEPLGGGGSVFGEDVEAVPAEDAPSSGEERTEPVVSGFPSREAVRDGELQPPEGPAPPDTPPGEAEEETAKDVFSGPAYPGEAADQGEAPESVPFVEPSHERGSGEPAEDSGDRAGNSEPAEAPLSVVEEEPAEETLSPAAVSDGVGSGEPFTVWDGDPFGEPAGPQEPVPSTVLAPVEAQAVTGGEGQNQLRLQLEGTGALAEYGQVRELDIVVPVPGDWIGGQKVTLQFRLTLVPKAEEE